MGVHRIIRMFRRGFQMNKGVARFKRSSLVSQGDFMD